MSFGRVDKPAHDACILDRSLKHKRVLLNNGDLQDYVHAILFVKDSSNAGLFALKNLHVLDL